MNVATSGAPVSRHLFANVLGRSWAFFSTFLFVPVYVHLLGIDNFGVIALFLAVGGIIALLDLGLSPTLARELHDQRRSGQEKANLLFTYEIAYATIVCVVVLCASLVPASVFSILLASEDLAKPDIASSIRLVFVAAATQLLFNFYVAGLMGVEEQIKGNVVVVAAGILRSAVVIIPLWLYPRPAVFLLWQVVVLLTVSAIARYLLYRSIGGAAPVGPRTFALRMIAENWSFTRGMFLVAVISAVLTQMDKLFISKVLGISVLAEYSLASTFAQLLVFVISPLTITLQPRFVRSATLGDAAGVRDLFLVTHKVVAATVCAAVGCMVWCGPYLISVWTVGKVEVDSLVTYVTPLVIGYASVALQTVPHAVAIANKNLTGILLLGGAALLVALPAYWYLINALGVFGAAITWLSLQIVLYPCYIGWVNRKFIRLDSLTGLLVRTLLVPLLVALAIGLAASHLISAVHHPATNLLVIGAAAIVSMGCCLLITLHREDVNYLLRSVR